ncbi:MAG: hypothetical protein ABJZ55_01585 [Fuerstiella sp.]
MSFVDAFNLFEVYLWASMGTGFLIAAAVKPANRWSAVATGIMLILFAVSDWIELSTGAWWKPWWLFVWKAICVASLIGLGAAAYQRQKQENDEAGTDRNSSSNSNS